MGDGYLQLSDEVYLKIQRVTASLISRLEALRIQNIESYLSNLSPEEYDCLENLHNGGSSQPPSSGNSDKSRRASDQKESAPEKQKPSPALAI